jgi:uncharacterized protein involved in exopolysaccharide biosynthesis
MSPNLELVCTPAPSTAIEIKPPIRNPEIISRTLPGSNSNTTAIANDWQRAFLVLRNSWRLSGLFVLAVVSTTAIVTLLMKPTYEPEAKIEIDPPGREIFSLQSGMDGSADAEYLETQAQKLRSDELAVGVIRALGLAQKPEFAGKLASRAQEVEANYDESKAPTLTLAENSALRAFRDKLNVRRDTSSRLVFIKFASHDPVLAATVVNKLITHRVSTLGPTCTLLSCTLLSEPTTAIW